MVWQADAMPMSIHRCSVNFRRPYWLESRYPSHGFVIDLEEAKKLFKNVSEMDEAEGKIMSLINRPVHTPQSTPLIVDLGQLCTKEEPDNDEETDRTDNDEEADATDQRGADSGQDVEGQSSGAGSNSGLTASKAGASTIGTSNDKAIEQLLKSV